MISIDYPNFRQLDLNLLIVFDALFSERNVTRAAQRIGIGQSAMSHHLARLRTIFADELFVRVAQTMRPTPRATELAIEIRMILSEIQTKLLAPGIFDPATAYRTFRVGVPDGCEISLLPRLLTKVAAIAPGIIISVETISSSAKLVTEMLEQNLLDLAISSAVESSARIKLQRLYHKERYLCVYNRQRGGSTKSITLKEFVSRPQIRVSTHEEFENSLDTMLTKRRLKRRVMLKTPHSLSVPFIVSQTCLIANLPKQMALFSARLLGVTASVLPIEPAPYEITMFWHSSYDQDSGHQWLRKIVQDAAAEMQAPQASETVISSKF
jgi:LysR family transcriptional regulator, mexEF-oprN operon transcriptional activator